LANLRIATPAEQDAYAQAGAILRTFHGAGPPRAEPSIVDWLAARGEAWLSVARDVIDSRRRATVRAHLCALDNLSPIPAVPCHLDLTPRNLLYGGDGTVRLIDFEHARYDLAARDLVRLANRVWPGRPDLADAFVHSYGPLTDLDREVIEHWSPVDELTRHARARGLQLRESGFVI
jgi:Ser/Thr protein kinase RdoA (MazF antagonist)